MSRTFVLVHGTWHGGWAWDDVSRELMEKGHCVHAPTLAGHGPSVARAGISHCDCVDGVSAYIRQQGLGDITFVGHSFGGTVVQKLAERFAEKTAAVVFLDALVLDDGQCVFDNLPTEYVALFNDLAEASADNTMLIPWEIWRDNFIQDAPEFVARSLWERLSPEPNQVNLDRLDLKRFYSLAIPMTYIYLRQDKALPPGYFHPRMSSRLGGNLKLIEMDGSHEIMFTRPVELAQTMIDACAE